MPPWVYRELEVSDRDLEIWVEGQILKQDRFESQLARLAGNIINGSGWRKTAIKLYQILPSNVMRRLRESAEAGQSDTEDEEYWSSPEGQRHLKMLEED